VFAIVAAFLLSVVVVALLLGPHLVAQRVTGSDPYNQLQSQGDSDLYDRKERLVRLLKDLELDFSTSKLSVEEHSRMREPLLTELSLVLKQIDQLAER
jgi:hypothetical protein